MLYEKYRRIFDHYLESKSRNAVLKRRLVRKIDVLIDDRSMKALAIIGDDGMGKSAAFGEIAEMISDRENVFFLPYFAAVAPLYDDGCWMIDYFIDSIERKAGLSYPNSMRPYCFQGGEPSEEEADLHKLSFYEKP